MWLRIFWQFIYSGCNDVLKNLSFVYCTMAMFKQRKKHCHLLHNTEKAHISKQELDLILVI